MKVALTVSILTTGELVEHGKRLGRLQAEAKRLRKALKVNAAEQKAIKRTLKAQRAHDEWTEAHDGVRLEDVVNPGVKKVLEALQRIAPFLPRSGTDKDDDVADSTAPWDGP